VRPGLKREANLTPTASGSGPSAAQTFTLRASDGAGRPHSQVNFALYSVGKVRNTGLDGFVSDNDYIR